MVEAIAFIAAGGMLVSWAFALKDAHAYRAALSAEQAAHDVTRRELRAALEALARANGELETLRKVQAPVDVSYVDTSTGRSFSADALAKIEEEEKMGRERYEKEMDALMNAGFE